MSGGVKLTKAQANGLRWFAERDALGLFDWYAPTRVVRQRLLDQGLIEKRGLDSLGFLQFGISDAGRAALTSTHGKDGR